MDNIFAQFQGIRAGGSKGLDGQIDEFYVRIGRMDKASIDWRPGHESTFLDASGQPKWMVRPGTTNPWLLLDTFPLGAQASRAFKPKFEALPGSSSYYQALATRLNAALLGQSLDVKLPRGFKMDPFMEGYFHLKPTDWTSQKGAAFVAMTKFARRNYGISSDVVIKKYIAMTASTARHSVRHRFDRTERVSEFVPYPAIAFGGPNTRGTSLYIRRDLLGVAYGTMMSLNDRVDRLTTTELLAFTKLAEHLEGEGLIHPRFGMFIEATRYFQHHRTDKDSRLALPTTSESDSLFTGILRDLGLLTKYQGRVPGYFRFNDPAKDRLPESWKTGYYRGAFSMSYTDEFRTSARAILTTEWIQVIKAYLIQNEPGKTTGLLQMMKNWFPIREDIWNRITKKGGSLDQFISWLQSIVEGYTEGILDSNSKYVTDWSGDGRFDLYLTREGGYSTELAIEIAKRIQALSVELLSGIDNMPAGYQAQFYLLKGVVIGDRTAESLFVYQDRLSKFLIKGFHGDFEIWNRGDVIRSFWDLLHLRMMQNVGGYGVGDDLDILCEINGLHIGRTKTVGNYLYAELIHPRYPQWRMLIRIATNTMDLVRTGVQVFYRPGLGPTAFFDDIPADADNIDPNQRPDYDNWILSMIAQGKLTSRTAELWDLITTATNPTGINP